MWTTDIGFAVYWTAVATGLVRPFGHPILDDWNWSFLVLDLTAAATGAWALRSLRRGGDGRVPTAVSLALTHAAGVTALNFWTLRGDFDLVWWLPNLWLTCFPVVALIVLTGRAHHATARTHRQ
ncbi:DUF5360 family protein [Stackebrandtia albiflava]|nr:DUF5360 family protein [Stackebrandtia albiflava]